MNTVSISIAELLEGPLRRIREEMRKRLEEEALEIVAQEVAKISISTAELVSIRDLGHEIMITIRKEIKANP